VEAFLNPSGAADVEGFREPGANGLLYNSDDSLFLCNHGKRSVEKLDLQTLERQTLADYYFGQKFNSPNDLIVSKSGDIFFTDPPYGLTDLDASPIKELVHNGVYKLANDGAVYLMIDDMSFPNGVVLSPDEQSLFVTQSDPDKPHLYKLDLTQPGADKTLFFDFTPFMGDSFPGLPDGMVVDKSGNLFVTGPGGIFVITPDGTALGRILTGKASANCTFGEDGSVLFITNHDRLIKLQTKTQGLSWS